MQKELEYLLNISISIHFCFYNILMLYYPSKPSQIDKKSILLLIQLLVNKKQLNLFNLGIIFLLTHKLSLFDTLNIELSTFLLNIMQESFP